MRALTCHAELTLPHHPAYMPQILDRLQSFQARREGPRLAYAFGWLEIEAQGARVRLRGTAPDPAGLARLKDLMATAFRLYAREDAPEIVWAGDGAGDARLDAFRLMRVETVTRIAPHMNRVRLRGEGLDRFAAFGNMHVRLLLPGPGVVWPVAGPDGLPHWPDPARKPIPRVYTIRRMDAAAGWLDLDILLHGTEGPGSAWALTVEPGAEVGLIGPLGRPLRYDARRYILGADETGLPAVARLLETLPETTQGVAFVELADMAERQEIANRTRIRLEWLRRGELAGAVLAQGWDEGTFGWFAAESDVARQVREAWRGARGLGRDVTLVAAYWRRGVAGLMAG
ncbi:siderophore-interacting protein [Paenirhodobacter sp.]|uniref:siderophore-interacting protein n=1 Tax=Paenirhodobacter sp. TaxID=1965326 RepID=UPI003B3D51C1